MVKAKLFVLASLMNGVTVVSPFNNNVVFLKNVSLATLTTHVNVLVAVLFVFAAVAVMTLIVLPSTVGVPVTFEPLIVTPVGNAFAV